MTHLTFEQISDLAERAPGAEDREPHLAECAACRETLRKVRALVAAAHALPREIAPEPEVWSQLRERVRRAPRRRVWRVATVALSAIAATVVLFVGSMLVSPTQPGKAKGAGPQPANPQPATRVISHVALNYESTVDELRRALDARRATLAPATVRVVERSLATIDSAIAEARAALASDPANQSLVQILSAHYERKVDLLQRATELPSS